MLWQWSFRTWITSALVTAPRLPDWLSFFDPLVERAPAGRSAVDGGGDRVQLVLRTGAVDDRPCRVPRHRRKKRQPLEREGDAVRSAALGPRSVRRCPHRGRRRDGRCLVGGPVGGGAPRCPLVRVSRRVRDPEVAPPHGGGHRGASLLEGSRAGDPVHGDGGRRPRRRLHRRGGRIVAREALGIQPR